MQLRSELEASRVKLVAGRARTEVLEGDVKKLKGHIKALLTKADTDDRLIEGLKQEVRSKK
jgi:hypothetical protein